MLRTSSSWASVMLLSVSSTFLLIEVTYYPNDILSHEFGNLICFAVVECRERVKGVIGIVGDENSARAIMTGMHGDSLLDWYYQVCWPGSLSYFVGEKANLARTPSSSARKTMGSGKKL